MTAVVEPVPGHALDQAELVEFVRAHLARYKAPRHVVLVPSIGRSPAGKVDYKGLRRLAVEQLNSLPT